VPRVGGLKEFAASTISKKNDECLDHDVLIRKTDEEVRQKIEAASGSNCVSEFQALRLPRETVSSKS